MKSTQQSILQNALLKVARLTAALTSSVLSAQTVPASSASSPAKDETVVLSPFEVTAAGDRGYYGANTMSGTRLNTKIEDLASSTTVVTKEQMADFAMLDINDVFLYEASTEGTGTYTDFSFDSRGSPIDNTQLNPSSANRVRGVKTNPVQGEFAAREALHCMVANTGLVVVEDEKTGAIMINRVVSPNAPDAASRSGSNRRL